MLASKVWAAAAVTVLLAASAGAQDWRGGQGRLEGKVMDAAGQPVEGASVKLQLAGRGGTVLKTDKKGRWAIVGIVAGSWTADIEAEGYAVSKISIPLPSESTRIPSIEVKLQKATAAGPPPEVLASLKDADAAFEGGRFTEARTAYEKALADPKIAAQAEAAKALHLRIARCWSAENNYEKEMGHLQAVLDASPGDPVVINLMAQESLKAGKVEKGIELLGKLDLASIKNPDMLFNIGVLLVNANKPELALEYFSRSVVADPAYVDGYFQRALVYLQLQKFAECKADLTKVLELQPDGPKAETARKALAQLPK